mmetsp:Transcript_53949/g.157455  ORF Transcript_53949/g.157455 Transcript_53949/m.157455 type:complete len:480 (+) Transcript_53949:58-1497(+)
MPVLRAAGTRAAVACELAPYCAEDSSAAAKKPRHVRGKAGPRPAQQGPLPDLAKLPSPARGQFDLAAIPSPARGGGLREQSHAEAFGPEGGRSAGGQQFPCGQKQPQANGEPRVDGRLPPLLLRELASLSGRLPAPPGGQPACRALAELLGALLADGSSFPEYPDWELDLVAEFMGRALHSKLLPPGPLLSSAQTCIIAALRSPLGSKMTRFALRVLDQLEARIHDFPSLIEELKAFRLRKDRQPLNATSIPYACKLYPDSAECSVGHGLPGSRAGNAAALAPVACSSVDVYLAVLPMYVTLAEPAGALNAVQDGRQWPLKARERQAVELAGARAAAPAGAPAGRRESKAGAWKAAADGVASSAGKAARASNAKCRAGHGRSTRQPRPAASQAKAGAQVGCVTPAIQDLRALRATIEEEMKLKPRGGQPASQAFVSIDDASMVMVLEEDDLEDVPSCAAIPQPMETDDEEFARLQELCF